MEEQNNMSRQEFYGDNEFKKSIKKLDYKMSMGNKSTKNEDQYINYELIDPITKKTIPVPKTNNYRDDDEVLCNTTPSIWYNKAKTVCYGNYMDEIGWDEVNDAAFIIQEADILIPSLPGSGKPPPYDYLENVVEGPYLVVPIKRRDITNPIGEWKSIGAAAAYVLNEKGEPVSLEIPIDQLTRIGFGPYFPTTIGGSHWKGIPCRRPFEELLFGHCFETFFWGKALDEDGRIVSFRGSPCQNGQVYLTGKDPDITWNEPENVLEKISSISSARVGYGGPHTWGDLEMNPIAERKSSFGPLIGQPLWGEENYHPLNSNAAHPEPYAISCGSSCSDIDPDNPCEPKLSQHFNALYRFGPYKSKINYSNPFDLGCSSVNPDCCKYSPNPPIRIASPSSGTNAPVKTSSSGTNAPVKTSSSGTNAPVKTSSPRTTPRTY